MQLLECAPPEIIFSLSNPVLHSLTLQRRRSVPIPGALLAPAVHGGDLEGGGHGHDAGAVPQRIRGDQQAPR